MDDKDILVQIEQLNIGPPDASLGFSRRLARENDWSSDYSQRVISEYKRFIYLVYYSENEVTPSDEIDQAWHLHLTYTKSYWHDLCRDILGFELHHNPTKGGPKEQSKYHNQYADTLALYEKVYGESPPKDIWPDVVDRFEAVEDFVRVNKQKRWIIKKPNMLKRNLFAVLFLPTLLVACTNQLSEKGIWYWLKAALVAYVAVKVVKWLREGGGGGKGGSGCGSGCGGCGGCG